MPFKIYTYEDPYKLDQADFWEEISAPISIPAGIHSLFITYKGKSSISIQGFELI